MKKTLSLLVLCSILVMVVSCASTKVPESVSKPARVDERIIVDGEFSEDEIEVYDYVVWALLEMNQFRSNIKMQDDGTITITKIPTSEVLLAETTNTYIGYEDQYDVYIEKEKDRFIEKYGTDYSEAFDSYAEKNAVKTKVEPLFNSIEGIKSLSAVEEQIDPSAKFEKYYAALYEAAPACCGKVALSNIGFNNDGTKALIQVEFHQGSMSGFIDYLFLTKTDGWQIENSDRIVYF